MAQDIELVPCVDCDQPATYYGMYCPEHLPKWVPGLNFTKQTNAKRTDQETEQ